MAWDGSLLRQAMADKRVNQSELGRRVYGEERAGSRVARNRGVISQWVRGTKEPRLDSKYALAKALGIDVHELLGDGAGLSQTALRQHVLDGMRRLSAGDRAWVLIELQLGER